MGEKNYFLIKRKKMKIACWNVNGIRACVKKGFLDWVAQTRPDTICLQEMKIDQASLTDELRQIPGYTSYFSLAERKGYSGVAVYCKKRTKGPIEVRYGLGKKKFDSEGRTLVLEYEKFTLFNCYFPNGGRDHSRVKFKLEFSQSIMKQALAIQKERGLPVIICGDYNTAHKEIDLANPKANKKTTGFLPEERAFLDQMEQNNFVDCFRFFSPDTPDEYTWWTYRQGCRERNIGWRIDYFFATKDLSPKLKKCYHDQSVLGSDHCPLFLELNAR